MTQLVLHIGDPKTGSSSIQTVLYEQRLSCQTKCLVSPREFSEAKLAATLHKPARRKDRAAQMKAKAQWLAEVDADIAVLSAEQFCNVEPRVLHNALSNRMPEHAEGARIIAYVRPHHGRFVSSYAQKTKCGVISRSPEKYHKRSLKRGFFTYFDRFSRWRDVFGERFVLRPMVRSELKSGDLTQDFFDVVLDGAQFEIDAPQRVNEALNLQQLACVRVIQTVLREKEIDSQMRVAVGSFFGLALNDGTPKSPESAIEIHRALAEEIAQDYAEDAKRLDDMFFAKPILQTALENAVQNAVASEQGHDLAAHTSVDKENMLVESAKTLAEALRKDGKIWKNMRLSSIGQQPQALLNTDEEKASAANVQRVLDKLVDQIKDIGA